MMQSFFEMALLDSALVQAALRSAVLAIAIGAGLKLLRVRNPHHQLAAWSAVLLISVLMPVLMRLVVVSVPADSVLAESMRADAVPTMSAPAMLAMNEPVSHSGEIVIPPSIDVGAVADTPANAGIDWMMVLAAVYVGVATILVLRLVIGLALTVRLRNGATRVYALWTGDSDVRVTDAITAPVTVGETILLPAEHEGWSAEKRRAVLLHERAHVGRGDFYVQVIASLHRAVFWFSPVAWWLHEKLAELAEHASDAEAAAQLDRIERIDYAAVLLEFAHVPQTTRFRVAPVAVAMARPAAMSVRIERVLADNGATSAIRQGVRLAIAGLVVAGGLTAAISVVETPANAAVGVETAPVAPVASGLPVQAAQPAEPAKPVPLVPPVEAAPTAPPAGARYNGPGHVYLPPMNIEIPEHSFPGVHIPPITVDVPGIDVDVASDMAEIRRGIAEARIEARAEAAARRAEAARERHMQMVAAQPSGLNVRETRNVDGFSGVSFGGSGKVFITVGPQASVVLEGDAEILKRTRTEVEDGVLRIRQRSEDFDVGFGRRSDVTAYITVPTLNLARVSGSGDLKVTGLNGGDTNLSISGSGNVEAEGKLATLKLSISGSGSASMPGLVVDDANISISGSGSAVVDVREDLNVHVSGSGNVRYLAQPRDISTSISGSGSVRRRDT